jgi:hypothetical protein
MHVPSESFGSTSYGSYDEYLQNAVFQFDGYDIELRGGVVNQLSGELGIEVDYQNISLSGYGYADDDLSDFNNATIVSSEYFNANASNTHEFIDANGNSGRAGLYFDDSNGEVKYITDYANGIENLSKQDREYTNNAISASLLDIDPQQLDQNMQLIKAFDDAIERQALIDGFGLGDYSQEMDGAMELFSQMTDLELERSIRMNFTKTFTQNIGQLEMGMVGGVLSATVTETSITTKITGAMNTIQKYKPLKSLGKGLQFMTAMVFAHDVIGKMDTDGLTEAQQAIILGVELADFALTLGIGFAFAIAIPTGGIGTVALLAGANILAEVISRNDRNEIKKLVYDKFNIKF